MLIKCPHCSAPVTLPKGQTSMECQYCHSLIREPAAPSVGQRGSVGGIAVAVGCLVVVLGAAVLFGVVPFFMYSRPSATDHFAVSAPVVAAPLPEPVPAMPAARSPVTKVTSFGEEGTGPGQLSHAVRIAVASDGAVFVAESTTGRVQKFTAQGAYVDVITLPPDALTKQLGVFGLSMDVKDHLFVNRVGDVLVYDAKTLALVRTVAGSYPDRYFHGGLDVDATSHLFALTDRTGDVDLVTVDAKGTALKRKRVDAKDVAVDGVGTKVLVGDELTVLDAKDEVVVKVGGVNGRAVALDGKGHVFVATGSTVEVFGLKGAKVQSLPVRADDLTLDASHRLVTLSGSTVEVHEVEFAP